MKYSWKGHKDSWNEHEGDDDDDVYEDDGEREYLLGALTSLLSLVLTGKDRTPPSSLSSATICAPPSSPLSNLFSSPLSLSFSLSSFSLSLSSSLSGCSHPSQGIMFFWWATYTLLPFLILPALSPIISNTLKGPVHPRPSFSFALVGTISTPTSLVLTPLSCSFYQDSFLFVYTWLSVHSHKMESSFQCVPNPFYIFYRTLRPISRGKHTKFKSLRCSEWIDEQTICRRSWPGLSDRSNRLASHSHTLTASAVSYDSVSRPCRHSAGGEEFF